MKNRHLYIAIGTKHRELDAKILFACHAAKAGYKVYVGSVSAIQKQLPYLPKGIYIKQLVTEGTAEALKKIRSYGHTICAFDEEGLVFPDPEAYKRERISANAMEHVSKFFAWGEYQAKLVCEVIGPENANKVVVTGHPRLDILRPEWRDFYKPQAEAYQKEHGRYILINTNFDLFNHADGREAFFERLRNAGRINSPEAEKWFRGWAAFRGRMYRCFRELVQELATQLPDKTFIIRPHPSENHDEWRRFTKDLKNVKVIYESAAIPWILGSDALIHNGCTTAVEAYVLGKPVISYQPFEDDRYDNYLANKVGLVFTCSEKLIDLISCDFNDTTAIQEIEPTFFIESIYGTTSGAKIIRTLNTLEPTSFILFDFLNRIAHQAKTLKRTALGRQKSANVSKLMPKDSIQRNPGVDLNEVRNIVSKVHKLSLAFENLVVIENASGLSVIKIANIP